MLPVNTHPDRQWRVLDTFDWYSPRYQDKDCSPRRVLRWCIEGGIRDVRAFAFQTSIRGKRDTTGTLPQVNDVMPDVRRKRVLVFGAGAAGREVAHFLRQVAPLSLVGIVDNDTAKHGMQVEGCVVQRFDEVSRDTYDLVVIASLPGRAAIGAQLRAAGLVAGTHFVDGDEVQQWYDMVTSVELKAA